MPANHVEREKIEVGKIVDDPRCPYGKYQILEELPDRIYEGVTQGHGTKTRMILIQYLNTGTIVPAQYFPLKRGHLFPKDVYMPFVLGIACIGNPNRALMHDRKEYKLWHHILKRCYDKKSAFYYAYGAIGVKMCDQWLCFEIFLNDIVKLENYDKWVNATGYEWVLDKDKLQKDIPKNQRIYSPETCCFITNKENIKIMNDENNYHRTGEYYGVRKSTCKSKETWQAFLSYNNKTLCFGTFYNKKAAAVVRDYYGKIYDSPSNNNIKGMPIQEALTYKSDYNKLKPLYKLLPNQPKKLYKLINKDNGEV